MNWVGLGFFFIATGAAAAQPEVARDLNERGLAMAARGDHAEAERLYAEAIDLWRNSGPPYQAHLATTESNLAMELCAEGKRSEGIRLLEEALALYRESLGIQHIRALATLNFLAALHLMLENDFRAATLFEEALPIERALYPNDAQLGRTLLGLAQLRARAAKYEQALPLAEEALNIALKTEGEESAGAGLAYATVAEVHRGMGETDRALPLLRKARFIYERALGPSHPRVAGLLSQEGLILMEEGKLSLAEQSMTRSLEMLAKTCPECAFEQLTMENNLGLLRFKQGKLAEADRLLTHVLSLEERSSLRPGPNMASTLEALARVREKERRHEDAARFQQRAELILHYQ